MPVVYIDMLFLVNLLMNTIIIYCSSLVLKKSISTARLFIVSVFLALYAVLMFFPSIGFLYSLFFKIIILIIAAVSAFPAKGIYPKLKAFVVVFSVYTIFAGTLFALIFTTDFGTRMGSAVSNGEIYLNLKASTLLLSIMPAYVCVYIISCIRHRHTLITPHIFKATATFFNKDTSLYAFGDTGCNLVDSLTGKTAIVTSRNAAGRMFPEEVLSFIDGNSTNLPEEYLTRYRTLPIRTISDSRDVLHGFVSDKITIENQVFDDIIIAVSKSPFFNCEDDYDLIFNPCMLNQH